MAKAGQDVWNMKMGFFKTFVNDVCENLNEHTSRKSHTSHTSYTSVKLFALVGWPLDDLWTSPPTSENGKNKTKTNMLECIGNLGSTWTWEVLANFARVFALVFLERYQYGTVIWTANSTLTISSNICISLTCFEYRLYFCCFTRWISGTRAQLYWFKLVVYEWNTYFYFGLRKAEQLLWYRVVWILK